MTSHGYSLFPFGKVFMTFLIAERQIPLHYVVSYLFGHQARPNEANHLDVATQMSSFILGGIPSFWIRNWYLVGQRTIGRSAMDRFIALSFKISLKISWCIEGLFLTGVMEGRHAYQQKFCIRCRTKRRNISKSNRINLILFEECGVISPIVITSNIIGTVNGEKTVSVGCQLGSDPDLSPYSGSLVSFNHSNHQEFIDFKFSKVNKPTIC